MIYLIKYFIQDWIISNSTEKVINKLGKCLLHKKELKDWLRIYNNKKLKLYQGKAKIKDLQLLIVLENKLFK